MLCTGTRRDLNILVLVPLTLFYVIPSILSDAYLEAFLYLDIATNNCAPCKQNYKFVWSTVPGAEISRTLRGFNYY